MPMPTPTSASAPDGPAVVRDVDASQLRAAVEGAVLTPADPGWDAARTPWNLAADRSPALVAEPASEADVVAIVEFARRHQLRVAPQCTGHNAGSLSPLGDAILLLTGRLQGVAVDPGAGTVRVQAGTQWGAVTAAADPHGLFPLAGSSPNVGVVGYTLGGGLSFLSRKHGLAANHVTWLRLVTPDGQARDVTAETEPDLFWAVRGGAANFGVVTAMEFGLFRYGHVTAGMFLWPYERHLEILECWHGWTRMAADDVSTSFRILHFPPLDDLPPFLAGRSVAVIDGVFAGPAEEARAALAGLRALGPEVDTWAPCSPSGLDGLHLDPPGPVPGLSTTLLLDELDASALERFAAAVPPGGPLMFGELRHLGGALRRAPAGGGATSSILADYCLYGLGVGTESGNPAIRPALAELSTAMAPSSTGLEFANFAERPTAAGTLFGAAAYDRLRRLRADADPGDVMLAGHPVPAA
jgi:FAD binding domain